MRTLLLSALFLAAQFMAQAQLSIPYNTWKQLDDSIARGYQLKKTGAAIDSLKQAATRAGATANGATIARCWYLQLKIKDRLTEDSLFFKNSAFVDSMLQSAEKPTGKLLLALQLIKAYRLARFVEKHADGYRQSLVKNSRWQPAYHKMETPDLLRHTEQAFADAVTTALMLNDQPVEDMLWLSSQPLSFLFKPTLADMVIAEEIDFLQDNDTHGRSYEDRQLQRYPPQWKQWPASFFVNLPDTALEKLSESREKLMTRYRFWMRLHLEKNAGTAYAIENRARNEVWNNGSYDNETKTDSLKELYLTDRLQSGYAPVKAFAVSELCKLWHKKAQGYDKSDDYYSRSNKKYYDNAVRLYHVKWLELFEQEQALLDSFGQLRNGLYELEYETKKPGYRFQVKEHHQPGKEIPVLLQYKNTPRLVVKIRRLDFKKEPPVNESDRPAWYLKQKNVWEQDITVTTHADHQPHRMYIKLPQLPVGRYAILLCDSFEIEDPEIRAVEITVTNIMPIRHGNRFFVLHRGSGQPLQGCTVWEGEERTVERKQEEDSLYYRYRKPVIVNGQAPFVIRENTDVLKVAVGNDTLVINESEGNEERPPGLYHKDAYRSLEKHFSEHFKIYLYTDRGIYRPGQTIHYKGIAVGCNPHTAEPFIVTPENMQAAYPGLYQKLLAAKKQLKLRNPHYKSKLVSPVTLNAYGGFSGRYTLPKNAATGRWYFMGDGFGIPSLSNNSISVEEYKRPQYKIMIEAPLKPLRLGDSIRYTIKTTSFAGAPLKQVWVKYTVTRQGKLTYADDENTWWNNADTLLKGQAHTNDKGLLELWVKDNDFMQDLKNDSLDTYAHYTLSAEAVDASGETHAASETITLNNRPIHIYMDAPLTAEKQQLPAIPISLRHSLAGPLRKKVTITVYKAQRSSTTTSGTWPHADVWMLDRAAFEKTYPALAGLENQSITTIIGEKIYSTEAMVNPDYEFVWPPNLLATGQYMIEVTCKEDGILLGKTSSFMDVYDWQRKEWPTANGELFHISRNTAMPGDTLRWHYGQVEDSTTVICSIEGYGKKDGQVVKQSGYHFKNWRKGLNEWVIDIPKNAVGEMKLQLVRVKDGELVTEEETVYIKQPPVDEPEITVERYRKQLAPGQKETFAVKIKTKDKKMAGELMTTLYDATLDKLSTHAWDGPAMQTNYDAFEEWSHATDNTLGQYGDFERSGYYSEYGGSVQPLWWLNPLDYAYDNGAFQTYNWGFGFDRQFQMNYQRSFAGTFLSAVREVHFAAGLKVSEPAHFAYNASNISYKSGKFASVLKDSVTPDVFDSFMFPLAAGNALIRSKGKVRVNELYLTSTHTPFLRIAPGARAGNMSAYDGWLIVLDGELYKGKLSSIDMAAVKDMVILNGTDAAALFGADAAKGLLLLSTKGMIELPEAPTPPPAVVRRNFAETAFFFPALYADADGQYHIEFTLPESVTEWKWKMLAHDKNGRFAYLEKSIISQLPLMVQPKMPRVLYQGDRMVLKSRISNLDSSKLKGTVSITVEDMVTGKDITAQVAPARQTAVSLQPMETLQKGIALQVPDDLLNPLKIKVTVQTNGFADAEEHVIPVLTRQVLVSQSVPYQSQPGKKTVVTPPSIPANAKPHGVGLHLNPQPQAALLYALPYLANYPHGCAEQSFNKMLAYAMAYYLLDNDKRLAEQAANWQAATANALPDQPAEELMPWLQLGNNNQRQQQQLAALLKKDELRKKIETHFRELAKMQLGSGGFPWFPGGSHSKGMSAYILASLGRLKESRINVGEFYNLSDEYRELLKGLLDYCDEYLLLPAHEFYADRDYVSMIYARSFWMQQYPASGKLADSMEVNLQRLWKQEAYLGLMGKAELVAATLRLKSRVPDLQARAKQALQSIKEAAIEDGNGIRWKQVADRDDLSASDEELMAQLAETFALSGEHDAAVKGILKWLLQARSGYRWSNTRATAAILYLLYQQKNRPALPAGVRVAGEGLQVRNGLLTGVLSDFKPMSNWSATLQLEGDGAPATGSVHYYYFSAFDQLPGDTAGAVTIGKTAQWFNAGTQQWQTLTAGETLKPGDKLRITLTLSSGKILRYVMVEDKRAACLEPVDIESRQQYSGVLSYYQSVRDAGYYFFLENIPAGTHQLQYEVTVSQEGQFTNGPAMLQCMYQPEMKAYSNSMTVTVKE